MDGNVGVKSPGKTAYAERLMNIGEHAGEHFCGLKSDFNQVAAAEDFAVCGSARKFPWMKKEKNIQR